MPMRIVKTETEDELVVERIMHARRYSLFLDKKRCVGCEICQIVCPREAIESRKPTKVEGEKLKQPTIMIDENKCQFCGICNAICPFGALTLEINDERTVPVLTTESFPQVIHEIEIDTDKCPTDCDECEEACPFGLIEVSVNKERNEVRVEVDKDHCPCCRLCEVKCPYDAIHTRKIIFGSIRIHSEKCPESCQDCVDVCPIPGVLYLSPDGKVHVNDFCCIYCGVCRIVCPVEEALEIQRTSVHHTPVRSGAWNKALEKLTSTTGMAKELRSKLIIKTQDSVRRRLGKEVL
ncbi:MAG: 4Fe-4S dicluster domain-containing protein [Candidatus Bathyarchaeia archaeon]